MVLLNNNQADTVYCFLPQQIPVLIVYCTQQLKPVFTVVGLRPFHRMN